ncbi:hypothetical protein HPB49_000025 [Dermacentor silvarum]|uniref:Uncharacterized protein n=1 Tax=Dermacentor silvarum TaxID=543639 RepID=A0ACB8CCB2_DERSI|nr:hypothetical protein HPB49_000025 [Dermacentor silvarum]
MRGLVCGEVGIYHVSASLHLDTSKAVVRSSKSHQLTCEVDCCELLPPCLLCVLGAHCGEVYLCLQLALCPEPLLSLGDCRVASLLSLELDLECSRPPRIPNGGYLERRAGGGDSWAAGFARYTGERDQFQAWLRWSWHEHRHTVRIAGGTRVALQRESHDSPCTSELSGGSDKPLHDDRSGDMLYSMLPCVYIGSIW